MRHDDIDASRRGLWRLNSLPSGWAWCMTLSGRLLSASKSHVGLSVETIIQDS